MSGYDVDLFDPRPDPDLICPICQCVFNDPVECKCRHVFCRVCVETWLSGHDTCPTCRKNVDVKDLSPVMLLVQNLVNRLTMKCPFHENGCKDVFQLEKYKVHMETCLYEEIRCRYKKCEKMMLRKDFDDHYANCRFRETMCTKHCGLLVLLKDLPSHNCIRALKEQLEEYEKQLADLQAKNKELQLQLDEARARELQARDRSPTSSNDDVNSVVSLSSFLASEGGYDGDSNISNNEWVDDTLGTNDEVYYENSDHSDDFDISALLRSQDSQWTYDSGSRSSYGYSPRTPGENDDEQFLRGDGHSPDTSQRSPSSRRNGNASDTDVPNYDPIWRLRSPNTNQSQSDLSDSRQFKSSPGYQSRSPSGSSSHSKLSFHSTKSVYSPATDPERRHSEARMPQASSSGNPSPVFSPSHSSPSISVRTRNKTAALEGGGNTSECDSASETVLYTPDSSSSCIETKGTQAEADAELRPRRTDNDTSTQNKSHKRKANSPSNTSKRHCPNYDQQINVNATINDTSYLQGNDVRGGALYDHDGEESESDPEWHPPHVDTGQSSPSEYTVETDSDYEVRVPKTASQLLDEYESCESDDSWKP